MRTTTCYVMVHIKRLCFCNVIVFFFFAFRRVVAHSMENNFKECLSLTLIFAEDSAKKMGFGWSRYAKISFTLINHVSEKLSQRIGLILFLHCLL